MREFDGDDDDEDDDDEDEEEEDDDDDDKNGLRIFVLHENHADRQHRERDYSLLMNE